ncbi:TetR/AcrR family transcriptional regulator [Actinoallomurus spadix]|uniref:TetR/AcrR family transcriptional regulator C-terminal domain-containing protein n=1 Tax=Actinoallomurus spadix TaxID=79912 RepID=A0ABN0X7H0_9ACTN|nr:TetR/AcrR family transcriptional regulator [Actinoallomurus spadix]MCO5987056.1 TetR/AcrR family transcriptional regulator [Actinoallomurus spadix]
MPSNADPLGQSVWTRPPRSRGAQPTLSRAQIVRTAIELLDEKGLDGLSMRRLGERLAAGATSAYWYVATKDELLELVLDEVMGEIEVPEVGATDWRTAATALAHGLRSMILRHPWVTGLFGVRPMMGPNAMRMSDRTVGVLTAAGFSGMDVAYASSLLMSHVIGSATMEAAWKRSITPGTSVSEAVDELRPYIDEVSSRYPHYGAWWRENRGMDPENLQDEGFAFAVERLLDGLQLWLDRRNEAGPA